MLNLTRTMFHNYILEDFTDIMFYNILLEQRYRTMFYNNVLEECTCTFVRTYPHERTPPL